ncbi:MAG: nucleoside triphosphate pyrophosphohydrolase [Defluviitaleaceae bacterium]|nr:nucleoside triphosphate pyrophosphohydrolase [Defluviitaleaceae bacterium]
MIYNKLVRDKIPEIIKSNGTTPIYRVLNSADYLSALNHKLQEEVTEYLHDNSIEEICDILEVAYAIAAAKGYTAHDLTTARNTKNEKNGAFHKRIFLEEVISTTKETNPQ